MPNKFAQRRPVPAWAAAAIVLVLLAGCAVGPLSVEEELARSEAWTVDLQYINMWGDRLRGSGPRVRELEAEHARAVQAWMVALQQQPRVEQGRIAAAMDTVWETLHRLGRAKGREETLLGFFDQGRRSAKLSALGTWLRQELARQRERAERHEARVRAYLASHGGPPGPATREWLLETDALLREDGQLQGAAEELTQLEGDLQSYAQDLAVARAEDARRLQAEIAASHARVEALQWLNRRMQDQQLLDALNRSRTCFWTGTLVTCY